MASLHHKPIKRFSLDGTIRDDSRIAKLRDEYRQLLLSEMRYSGYVQRLDIDEDFTIRYNETTEYFEFELSMYAIYVGKKQSEWISGLDGTRVIFTQQSKFNASYLAQESTSNQK